jgi:hypothetical protein
MTRPWFRFYRDTINSARVQNLPAETFRVWVNILCATDDFGAIPESARLSFALRTSKNKVEKHLQKLLQSGLLIETENGLVPRNWHEHQYKSDGSAERMKRHRERHRDVTPTVSVTGPERDTDIRISKNSTGLERLPWPREAVVPQAWIDDAAAARALAGQPEVDLAALGAKFRAHYEARDERRTADGWRAKFLQWSIQEKSYGQRTRNTTGDTIRELARMARGSQGGTGGDHQRG